MWSLMNPPQPPVDKTQHCVDTRQPDSTPSCLLFSLSLCLSYCLMASFIQVKKHCFVKFLCSSSDFHVIQRYFCLCLMAFILKRIHFKPNIKENYNLKRCTLKKTKTFLHNVILDGTQGVYDKLWSHCAI